MAETQEYQYLSDIVYGGTGAPTLPTYWVDLGSQIPENLRTNKTTGFSGNAYFNTSNGEVVIVFAGTSLTDGGDRRADLDIVNGVVPAQYFDAQALYNHVAGTYGATAVSFTGHSLGSGARGYRYSFERRAA
jgi:hypothetical protein